MASILNERTELETSGIKRETAAYADLLPDLSVDDRADQLFDDIAAVCRDDQVFESEGSQ